MFVKGLQFFGGETGFCHEVMPEKYSEQHGPGVGLLALMPGSRIVWRQSWLFLRRILVRYAGCLAALARDKAMSHSSNRLMGPVDKQAFITNPKP